MVDGDMEEQQARYTVRTEVLCKGKRESVKLLCFTDTVFIIKCYKWIIILDIHKLTRKK